MAGNGIFGGGRGTGARNSAEQVKRREIWLVVLGIFLHAVYMLSIFDIYFKTPIVHGTDPVPQRITAPAKRLVLLVADGLRADKFFEPDSEGRFRAPFLRSVIKERGRWGVSHARPPTESRPGHVAIIAGFYEDPSAVTKGWKANPVEFDSVFNRSQHTFAYGSPDIIPIFCGALPHCTWNSYPHEFEDFAADASFLDHWSYDELEHLLNRSNHDLTLQKLLKQDKLVIFLHLLGCDTNGHAHRPFSSIYLNNVKVVDHIAASVYNLMENYFGDNQTAYIFTADHGMSDKGSHGDGHPTNTDTPLVAWGAGIRTPKRASRSSKPSDNFHFVDEHSHDMPTPLTWDLDKIERVDVNQADIAPLMATLVGLPCPINSVGNLPLEYLNLTKADEVEADLANTKQILNQCLRKSQLKQSTSFHFKPFKPLENFALVLHQIEDYISKEAYEAAMELSQNLRRLSLSGLHYFQTYDWLMLMTAVTLGYVGWIINLVIHLVQSYTSLDISKTKDVVRSKYSIKVYLGGCLAVSLFSLFLFIEKSPILYHAYVMMTLFLWMRIFSHFWILIAIWKYFCRKGSSSLLKHLLVYGVAIIISEFLVSSFSERRMYTWFFLIVGPIKALHLYNCVPQRISMAVFIGVSCWLLSVFTLMPAEIPDNTSLVITSGALVILIGAACKVTERRARADKLLSYISLCDKQPCRVPYLFFIQGTLVGLSSIMVWICSSRRSQKKELLLVHQIMNWSIIGISMVLPLFSPAGLLSRLNSIFLGFAPPFLLLSIGYESLFYGAFALVLVSWVLSESAILYPASARRLASDIDDSLRDIVVLSHEERNLQLSDIRIPLTFMVLFNVAFFGTGNFASIASFEISSVYRFITIFNPFLMAGLLIFKLFIPFMLVICVFSAITKLIHLPRIGCYFLVILFSDVMTIHFFFLVRNTGSWMEIGNSISHFGIMSAQVIFVLFLFALTNIYTRDIVVVQNHFSSRKAT